MIVCSTSHSKLVLFVILLDYLFNLLHLNPFEIRNPFLLLEVLVEYF